MLARIKFDIVVLVKEMLDHIPEEYFKSTTTTFFDPAMAGGQFVVEVIQRLRDNGHNDDNIASRVFGLAEDVYDLNYAIRTKKLIGKYSVGGIEQMEEMIKMGMKFDVCLGNPPYKNGNEKGGKSSLWRKIVGATWPLVKDGGYMAMVTPQFSNSSRDLGYIYCDSQTTVVWTQISHHFPGVGSAFSAWIVNKVPASEPTLFVNEQVSIVVTKEELPANINAIGIIQKIKKHHTFECRSSPEYFHTSVKEGKDEHHLSSQQTPKLPYVLRRTSGDNERMYGAVLPTDYNKAKVVFTFSGNPHYKFHSATDPIGTIKFQSGHILVDNKTQGERLIQVYQSKLYRFVQQQITTAGMRGKTTYEMPAVDLTRSWTDADLYKHFNLTQEEIDLIEATVK